MKDCNNCRNSGICEIRSHFMCGVESMAQLSTIFNEYTALVAFRAGVGLLLAENCQYYQALQKNDST